MRSERLSFASMESQGKSLSHREKRQGLICLCCFIAAPLFYIVFFAESWEAVPDRAIFAVDHKNKIIVPYPIESAPLLIPMPEHPGIRREEDLRGWNLHTWKEIEGSPTMSKYSMPASKEWQEIRLHGKKHTIFDSWVNGYESRWDRDGRWRY